MKTLFALSMALATAATTLACGDYAALGNRSTIANLDCDGQVTLTNDDLARDAVGTNKTKAEDAIRRLRARGPEGLRALLEANPGVLQKRKTATLLLASQQPDDSWQRVRSALDGVSGQRDCYVSQLYWYTDFEQAKAAAKAQAKPILSLRLLGKLDEEFSCANSRFFRTTLYANAEVSQFLRDHFILHWKSVRPAPRVTIDFGDGRKLERTITGNSIHYVLAADGGIIDALPGLYGPNAFLKGLNLAEAIARQTASLDPRQRMEKLSDYHLERIAALDTELKADLRLLSAFRGTLPGLVNVTPLGVVPTARTAADVTHSKFLVERPLLNSLSPDFTQADYKSSEIGDATWSKIAALHAADSRLDASSQTLIRAKNPTASDARRAAVAKTVAEDPLLRQIRNLERSISEDTCRNEYLLHPRIHAWLAAGEMTNVDELNRKVYAELFLTPDSDPWLGLAPVDTFTALENNGVAQVRGDNSKTASTTSLGL